MRSTPSDGEIEGTIYRFLAADHEAAIPRLHPADHAAAAHRRDREAYHLRTLLARLRAAGPDPPPRGDDA